MVIHLWYFGKVVFGVVFVFALNRVFCINCCFQFLSLISDILENQKNTEYRLPFHFCHLI